MFLNQVAQLCINFGTSCRVKVNGRKRYKFKKEKNLTISWAKKGPKTDVFSDFWLSAYRQTRPNIRYRIFGGFWPNIRLNIRYSVVHYCRTSSYSTTQHANVMYSFGGFQNSADPCRVEFWTIISKECLRREIEASFSV